MSPSNYIRREKRVAGCERRSSGRMVGHSEVRQKPAPRAATQLPGSPSAGHNRQAHLKRAHLGLMMLTDRKDIAIWIFEPPYLVTRGSRPNSKLTILNEGVLFQDNAFVPEPSDHGFDIFYFPAQDRTLQWSEIRDFCDPNLVPSDANDQCVLIDAYKLKSEISFIEGTRLPPLLCLFEKNEIERARAAPSGSNRQNKSPSLASGTRFQAKS